MNDELKGFLKEMGKKAFSIAVDIAADVAARYVAGKATGAVDLKLQDMKKNREWKEAFNSGDFNKVKAWLDKYKD